MRYRVNDDVRNTLSQNRLEALDELLPGLGKDASAKLEMLETVAEYDAEGKGMTSGKIQQLSKKGIMESCDLISALIVSGHLVPVSDDEAVLSKTRYRVRGDLNDRLIYVRYKWLVTFYRQLGDNHLIKAGILCSVANLDETGRGMTFAQILSLNADPEGTHVSVVKALIADGYLIPVPYAVLR